MIWLLLLFETIFLISLIFIIIRIKLHFSYTNSIISAISIVYLYIFLVGRILGDLSQFFISNLLISNLILISLLIIGILSSKMIREKITNKMKSLFNSLKSLKLKKNINLKEIILKIVNFDGLLLIVLLFSFIIICVFVPITSPNMLFQDLIAMEWIVENGSLPPNGVPDLLIKNNPYLEFFTGGVFQILLAYFKLMGGDFLVRALTPLTAILSILSINQLIKNFKLNVKKNYLVFGMILSPILLHFSTVANSDILIVLFTANSLLMLSEMNLESDFIKKTTIMNLAFAISILSFAVKFYGIISFYLCLLFYWKMNLRDQKEKKHPFNKTSIISMIMPLLMLIVVFERNLNYTANILPPYSIFELPTIFYSIPAFILASIISLLIILTLLVIAFYEIKIKFSQIIWWSLFVITYFVGMIIIDPMILFKYINLALFSFKTGDIATTFGPYILVVLAYYMFKRSKIISGLPKMFHGYCEIIIKGFTLIMLSQVIVLQHFSEGPIRYSFSMLYMLYPAVGILLQLFIEQFTYPKEEQIKRVKFVKITKKTTKQILRMGYGLAILYLFLGLPLGYLNPPGYQFIAPFKSDNDDLQHWRPYVANAINYINENMKSDEYALFTDPYVYLFDNPLNILTFTPNPDHRNRVVYERIKSYGSNITTEDLIEVLIYFNIKYFVTALGYSLDLLIENTPIIGEMLNHSISPMVFYEEDNTVFSKDYRYAAVWLFNY